jgi:hypothetical protein
MCLNLGFCWVSTLAYPNLLGTKRLRCCILQALSRAITEDELIYIRAQYNLLEPDSGDGRICIDNFRMVSTYK